jgi:hypothetical protein
MALELGVDLGRTTARLDRQAGGLAQRVELIGKLPDPGAGVGDHLHLGGVEVSVGFLGSTDEALDERVALFELRFEAGDHGIGRRHGRLLT